MTSLLRGVSWADRAAHYDSLAARYREEGNDRDATFAEVNAKTMRMCEAEGIPLDD